MRHLYIVACFTFVGCWSTLDEARPPDVAVIDVVPRAEVGLQTAVVVAFTAPLAPLSEPCPARVLRRDGRDVAIDCGLMEGDARLMLHPRTQWPADEELTLLDLDRLTGRHGEPIAAAASPLFFSTVRPLTAPELHVEGPEPGTRAPLNLRRIVATARGVDAAPDALMLVVSGRAIRAPVIARDDRGRVVAEVSEGAVLEPDTRYRVELEGVTNDSTTLQSFVHTATVADIRPPELRLRSVDRGGASLRVIVDADEAVFAWARATGPNGTVIDLVAPLLPSAHVELVATDRLLPQTRYTLVMGADDYAGLPAEMLEVQVVTPPEVRVRITELVPTPLHDWNDGPPGTPFDAFPGGGAVTDSDEWVELVNTSAEPIDLTQVHLRLRLLDGTPSEHDLLASSQLYFGRGGQATAWGVGEALVARPRGAMAQRELTAEVLWGDVVLDRVSIGRSAAADHGGGAPPDLDHESIARNEAGVWRWCAPTPGDPWPADCVR